MNCEAIRTLIYKQKKLKFFIHLDDRTLVKKEFVKITSIIKLIITLLLVSACHVNVLVSSLLNSEINEIGEGGSEPVPPSNPETGEEGANPNPLIQASLLNIPDEGSSYNSLSVGVGGDGVTHFRYKFGSSDQIQCENPTGYSNTRSISDYINDSLLSYYSESLKICVVGLNSLGEIQPYSTPTEHVWNRVVINEVFVAQSGIIKTENLTPDVIQFTIRSLYPAVLPIIVDYDYYGDLVETLSLSSGQVTILSGQSSVIVNIPIAATPMKSTDSFLRLRVSKVSATGGYSNFLTSSVYLIDLNRTVNQSIQSIGPSLQCAVLNNGHLICNGEIGTRDSTAPRFSEGWTRIGSPLLFKSVVRDGSYRCAISVSDEMYCWGWGIDGQLGLGTSSDHATPQKINGIEWKKATSFGNVMCGISKLDDLYCWGDQTYTNGLAGNGLTTDQRTPFNIDPTLKFEKVVMDDEYACAISKPDGVLKCWGSNSQYSLGDGTNVSRYSPVTIDSGQNYKDIYLVPDYACGITVTGSIKCWGRDFRNISGISYMTTPTLIDDSRTYTSIVATQFGYSPNVCALSEGRPYCYNVLETPKQFKLMDASSEIYEELFIDGLVCGKTVAKRIKCFGATTYDAQNLFFKNFRLSSATFWEDDIYESVYKTNSGTCGITTQGLLKCNLNHSTYRDYGSLSMRTPSIRKLAVQYHTTLNYLDLSLSCLINSSDKSLRCWGRQSWFNSISHGLQFKKIGQVLYGLFSDLCGILENDTLACLTSFDDLPTLIDSGEYYSDFSNSRYFGCGVTRGTKIIKCWGANNLGQLGVGDNVDRATPTPITIGEEFLKVMTTQNWVCGLSVSKNLYCWGSNSNGLGTGVSTSNSPVHVLPGTSFIDFSIAGGTGCAIRELDGRVLCWGTGRSLGVNTSTSRATPDVTADTDAFINIFSGTHSSSLAGFCGSTSTQTKCWGRYADAQGEFRIPRVVLDQGVESVKWANAVYLKGLDGKIYILGNTNNVVGSPDSYIGFEPLLGLYDEIIPDWSL